MRNQISTISRVSLTLLILLFSVSRSSASTPDTTLSIDTTLRIGLNYPKTGPYSVQGADQFRAASLAVEEINRTGGILGRKVELISRDSQSRVATTYRNVRELIDEEKVAMVFGGSASDTAIAASDLCRRKGVLFFGTLTYSTATTGAEGNRYTFRECYNSWMGAKALAAYLNRLYPAKTHRYFYITSDYTWGHTTEESLRIFTGTEERKTHKRITTPFPDARDQDFRKAIAFAKLINPDVLVLVLFGKDMSTAIRQATIQGLKTKMHIVVPNLTLGMAESGGPKVMEGIIGTLPWTWQVPYRYNYPRGKTFVETFAQRFNRYPSTSGASAYTIVYQYRDAVERAGSLQTPEVIRALEGHSYQLLKDKQSWRSFDHQSVQTVYTVRCKPQTEVLKDKFKLDFFEIVDSMPGEQAVRTRSEWNAARVTAGKPLSLEKLDL
ncbi:substrate-binding protein [Desulfogranum mediterraneum]|uniref:substrate-binding protein n=1 Tax=Desulfogranum mediterraneum TaxID=160661 RepID=UPI000404E022|nr:substrate-binding protein [Desulfogranum mediterraneum]